MSDAARRRIAHNRAAHDRLRGGYDARHPEIHNPVEQARLVASVARAVAAIRTATPAAARVLVDVGAGTGNLTEKLLAHPGRVIAADAISVIEPASMSSPEADAGSDALLAVHLRCNFHDAFFDLRDILGRLYDDPLATLQPLLLGTGHAFGLLGQLLGITVNAALYTILIPIYFFFFAWHFNSMSQTVVRLIPFTHRPQTLHALRRMDTAVRGFVFERLLITVITGVLYAAGWALTDVPYWFLLGVATGLASLVPYLSAIGWPLAVILKYADAVTAGQSVPTDWMAILLWPSVAYLVVQFIESWILTPWLQSHSTDMSAATILIVVFLGGAVGGLFGLIFAIPVAACFKILIEEFVRPRWLRCSHSLPPPRSAWPGSPSARRSPPCCGSRSRAGGARASNTGSSSPRPPRPRIR